VASSTVSSAKFAVVDSGEVGRSALYSRYNNGLRTLAWGMPTLTLDVCVFKKLAECSKSVQSLRQMAMSTMRILFLGGGDMLVRFPWGGAARKFA
jgi:hypothetical protein